MKESNKKDSEIYYYNLPRFGLTFCERKSIIFLDLYHAKIQETV
ncbi:hypothetical protein JMUB3935_1711 [Leptotrichia trevisanii]|uniref:Uncharacterized protein n=1 Tax=Leptotrichia trevisanii TaxID=109328 RepID=A0A510KPZ9_9FUSO|nr:hypothetical protein [Leptotrichia trevisanii]BBM52731.1 hypothetical protein JMUB3935_1711 [Leptotrichia trevisanii]